ncbi:MAG: hypothetical protein IJ419_10840 [Agathobacter sp.]|nr:hypothetical protein [Agathobacter sp.]
MSFIKKTLSISTKHLSKNTIDALRQVANAKKTDENDFTIPACDKYFADWLGFGDLRAIISFAKCMDCEDIHIHKDGEMLPFLMTFQGVPRDVDDTSMTLEFAYYGDNLAYKRLVE